MNQGLALKDIFGNIAYQMRLFNKKYTKYDTSHKSWKNGVFSAIIVLLIFFLFQPFGLQDKEPKLKMLLFPLYALLAFIYSTSTFLVVRYILKSQKNWTIKHELLCFVPGMIILTSTIHLVTSLITGDMPLNLYWYIKLFYHSSSLFLVIAALEFLYYSNKYADVKIGNLSSQIELFSRQTIKEKSNSSSDIVLISLEKDSLAINRNKIAFIQSGGNYLEFFLLDTENKNSKLVKRGRIHQVEKDLEHCLEFFRCHRAFIVNLKHVKQIKGNSKNARLILDGNLEDIPVSRSYFTTLKEQLEKIIVS